MNELEQYYKDLEKHDWYYNYSDDHRAWTKGLNESKRLQAICQEDDTLSKMYTDFCNWVNNPREIKKPQLEDYIAGVAQR